MSINIERFQQNLVHRTTASVRRLRKEIAQIAEFDRVHEAEENKSRKCVFIVISVLSGGFIGGIFVLAFPSIASFWIPFFLSLGILAIGTLIWSSIQHQRHSPFNLSQRRYRYELLQSLLEILQKDLAPSQKLKLSLNLQKEDDQSKFQKQESYPNRKDGKIDFYRDEWLKVKGLFLDETKFFLQVTELHQVRSWTNVNNKHKVRPVPKSLKITLSLNYRPERYPGLSSLENQADLAVKLPATVELKRIEITANKLTMKAKVPPAPETNTLKNLLLQSIVLMFLSSYQILNLARAMNQQQGA